MTRGGALLIPARERPVDPEVGKGGRISIRSQIRMICMIRWAGTRRRLRRGRQDHAKDAVRYGKGINYGALPDLAHQHHGHASNQRSARCGMISTMIGRPR